MNDRDSVKLQYVGTTRVQINQVLTELIQIFGTHEECGYEKPIEYEGAHAGSNPLQLYRETTFNPFSEKKADSQSEKNQNISDNNLPKKKSKWNGKNKILMKFKADLSAEYIERIRYLKQRLHNKK